MIPLLKVAAVGGACAGACYCTWWISSASGNIPFRDLSTDSDFETDTNKTYHNKYASDYSKYFVGVHDKAKGNLKDSNISNKAWWDWAFKNRYSVSTTKKKGFENVTSGDALRKVCEAAYKSESNKVSDTQGDTITHNESNVWAFCSIGGNKPKSISEATSTGESYGENNYGSKTEYSSLLISINYEDNFWFWDVKEKEFNDMTSYPEGLEGGSTSSKFKTEHSNRKQNSNSQKTIKDLCKEAYATSDTSNTNFPKKVVFKFCSLSGKEPQTEDVQRAVET